jgi:hypothetical protein
MFDATIPILKEEELDQEHLDALKKRFAHYDESYVANACFPERRKVFDEAYELCKPYLDDGFVNEIKKPGKFMDRVWELALCSILLHKGYKLEKWKKTRKPRPDFCILLGDKKIWVEAICPALGEIDGVEPPPDLKPGVIFSRTVSIADDVRPRALRVSSALTTKLKKRDKYIKGGLMKETEPYIVAVNTNRVSYVNSSAIEELTLYGMGLHQINIRTNEASRQWVPEIPKHPTPDASVSVPIAVFLRDEYKGISAAIFHDRWFEFDTDWKDYMANKATTYFNEGSIAPLQKDDINFGVKKYIEITDVQATLKEVEKLEGNPNT